jgi:DeoR family ulaG and ulaABCDEF operon transcriptional repressor
MFMSAKGVSRMGVMEGDPLLIQAEQKLIDQAEELVLLVDSSKFASRSSLILCPLERVHTVITDDGIATRDAKMIEQAGVRLIVGRREVEREASSAA